jgi:hypothetical protein
MNTGMNDYLLEEHLKDIRRDMQQIHLEQEALRGRVFRPNTFTRSMEAFGKWLITRGELLVKRYESPKKRCQHAGQNSYAN